MGLRISRKFGSRGPSQTEEPVKKVIFVFEGEKTEKQYFEGLFNYRQELGIKDIIEIKTLKREDGSHSNQKKIVEELHVSLQEVIALKQNKNEIFDFIKLILERYRCGDSFSVIKFALQNVLNGKNIEENMSEIVATIEEIAAMSVELEQFIEQLNNLKDLLDYEREFDTVCIIIDRDKQSFKEFQYDEVLDICKNNNYKLGITNPCFEFWLLLHVNDCKGYNKWEIIENKRTSKSRRYIESLLVNNMGSYKKNNLDFGAFKPGIKDAIERSKEYCEDPNLLKNNIGTSIGVIISGLI